MLSEKEKMLAGEDFFGLDPEIVAIRARAQELTFQYNSIISNNRVARYEIMELIFQLEKTSLQILI